MAVTTFQNGEGLDVEVYARLEGRAFLFRREPETEDKKIQIRGWPLSGDPSLVEYTNAMRLHYFMSTEEPRRATYLAEIGEEEEGSKGDVITDEDDLLRVIMPFDVSRQLRDDGERDRLPSPVARALFGEPPVKLRRKRLSLREPGSVPDIELCPWVLYEWTGFPRRWSAKRQASCAYIPLSLDEMREHDDDLTRGVGQEVVDELIRAAPSQPSSAAEHAATDNRYNRLFTPEYKQWELDTWQYCITQKDQLSQTEFKFMVDNVATRMITWVYGDRDAGTMVCNVRSKGDAPCLLNGPKQFIDHCVGSKHCKSVKDLK